MCPVASSPAGQAGGEVRKDPSQVHCNRDTTTGTGKPPSQHDCSMAWLLGVVTPYRDQEDQWVLRLQRGTLPVQVHETLLADLKTSQQPQPLLCRVRWDWTQARLMLTVMQRLAPHENHWDHYIIRGTVVRIGRGGVVMRITPSGAMAGPFEIPVMAKPNWLEMWSVGQRIDLICVMRQGWLHARQWYAVRNRENPPLAEAG